MCGICGWLSWAGEADGEVVQRMAERLAHRGPDGDGLWCDVNGRMALGHRRLKVLDVSERAHQPMSHPSGAVLIYNGEVYSFHELRRTLEEEGEEFTSTGDTAVVAAALARWGTTALQRFNGMFALALWDPSRRNLLLARDRLGIKPLFWAPLGDGLVFASELPALLAHPRLERRLNQDALARWLQLGYLSGTETLLRGVYRLPPGHYLAADVAGQAVNRWYDLVGRVSTEEQQTTAAQAAEELEGLLRDAVRLRLVSDVPLGCFLSGGVDSTAVVAAAASEGACPETLTVSFVDGEDEGPVAARTAASLGLDHRPVRCTPEEMLAVFSRWARVAGDPIADPSLVPTSEVSRVASQRWTVALSGDGGDELLSGYPRLRFMPRLEGFMALPSAVRQGMVATLPARRWASKVRAAVRESSTWGAYQALQGVWPAREVAWLVRREEVPPAWSRELLDSLRDCPPWRRYRLLDASTFLPERVLAKVDRASMEHSLEVRVPLLDHRIVEHLLTLPGFLARGKGVLRRVLARLGAPQPPRRKRGFEVPLGSWLRGPLRGWVEERVLGTGAADLGLDPEVLRQTWDEHRAGRADHGERLQAVAVLVAWAESWL